MFCQKCETKVSEGSTFCHKCGAKITTRDTGQVQPRVKNPQPDIPKKKKFRKLPVIIGVTVLAIVAINWNEKIEYEAAMRAHQPFVNQGTPRLDQYISSSDWRVHKSGVDISGKVRGTDTELVVTDPIDSDLIKIAPEFVTIDGKKSPAKDTMEFLLPMFFSYDEGYNNLPVLLARTELTEAQEKISLTETYTNDAVGISFNYPAGWMILNPDNEFEIVEMIDHQNNQNNAAGIASFKIFNIFNQNPFGVFTGDKASIRESVNKNATFLEFEDTLPGDVFAKSLKYRTEGLKGDDIITNFWYVIGNNVYQITCSYSASASDTYEPIFKEIMKSYTITTANTSEENVDMGEILYKNIPVSSFFDTLATDVAYTIGLPKGADRDDDIRLYILPERSEVESAEVWNTSALTVNGIPLNKNRDGLIEIFGQPIEEGNNGNGYFMRYHLSDCSMYFELGESDSEAWRISISPNTVLQDDSTVLSQTCSAHSNSE